MTATAPKKPLFSKPAWATVKSSTQPSSDTGGIFGRSTVYEDILQADRLKREKREAKAKQKAQTYAETEKSEERQGKRRRTSGEVEEEKQEDDGSNTDVDSPAEDTDDGNDTEEDEEPKQRVMRSTPKKDKALTRGLEESNVRRGSPTKPITRKRAINSLDDDEEDPEAIAHALSADSGFEGVQKPASEEISQISTKPQSKLRTQDLESEDDEEEEDEYLRELKRRARQKRRDAKFGAGNEHNKNGVGTGNQILQSSSRNPGSNAALESQSSHKASNGLSLSEASTSAHEDPVVHIRITSKIPNTEELIVKRHASQSLQHVRDYWCKEQNFEDKFASRVFLTWRGTQLFNSTTSRSIIHRLQKEAGTSDGSDPSHGRIEVEAMIPEIFDLRKRQREKEIMEEAGLSVPKNGQQENGNSEEDELDAKSPLPELNADNIATASGDAKTKEDCVIRLVCQGLEPVIMRVRPSSKISKIRYVFEKMRPISPEMTCWLVFDGERLEPDATVKDVGLEDEDTVEVYLR